MFLVLGNLKFSYKRDGVGVLSPNPWKLGVGVLSPGKLGVGVLSPWKLGVPKILETELLFLVLGNLEFSNIRDRVAVLLVLGNMEFSHTRICTRQSWCS